MLLQVSFKKDFGSNSFLIPGIPVITVSTIQKNTVTQMTDKTVTQIQISRALAGAMFAALPGKVVIFSKSLLSFFRNRQNDQCTTENEFNSNVQCNAGNGNECYANNVRGECRNNQCCLR
jgi:hypothetical protein